jgi:hypothetical protein
MWPFFFCSCRRLLPDSPHPAAPFLGGRIRARQAPAADPQSVAKRWPNLRPADGVVAGLSAAFMRPGRVNEALFTDGHLDKPVRHRCTPQFYLAPSKPEKITLS